MHTEQFQVRTRSRSEFVDITSQVRDAIRASGVSSGFCVVFVPHTTAGVTINENADPTVVRDMLAHLERAVPPNAGYTHAEGNSDSHIKASMMGSSVVVPLVGGRIQLGTWQGIYFCEFDGPRRRSFSVTVTGDADGTV